MFEEGFHCKLQAFASDLMTILEDPINSSGLVSGLKMNKQKTYLLSKNISVNPAKFLERESRFPLSAKIHLALPLPSNVAL